MLNHQFQCWLDFISNSESSLLSPLGTTLWIDGINTLSNLDTNAFFKNEAHLDEKEKSGLRLLHFAVEESLEDKNFLVSGHASLMMDSPLYRHTNNKRSTAQLSYTFVDGDVGDFSPWNDEIILGTKFYSRIKGQTRIPFYTYNHENTHLTLFKKVYSNLNLNNEELTDLLILSEWFCISTDLILAYDLIKTKNNSCYAELCRVPFCRDNNGKKVFDNHCTSVGAIDSFSDKFRKTILGIESNVEVFDLISEKTLESHRDYAREILLPKIKSIPAALSRNESLDLLSLLKNEPLSSLINIFTGIQYE